MTVDVTSCLPGLIGSVVLTVDESLDSATEYIGTTPMSDSSLTVITLPTLDPSSPADDSALVLASFRASLRASALNVLYLSFEKVG